MTNIDKLKQFKKDYSFKPLVETITEIENSLLNSNHGWYEVTITLKPKFWNYKHSGQQQYIKINIDRYFNSSNFKYIFFWEYSKNNALHAHGVVRHWSGYEPQVRTAVQAIARRVGRTSCSELRSPSYLGYMTKDYCKTRLEPKYNLTVSVNDIYRTIGAEVFQETKKEFDLQDLDDQLDYGIISV